MTSQSIFILYLLIINLTAFSLMGIDKQRARQNRWRIAEKTLFLVAVLGGSFGMRVGMEVFRHKTKHKTFTIGIPIIFLLQVTSLLILLKLTS